MKSMAETTFGANNGHEIMASPVDESSNSNDMDIQTDSDGSQEELFEVEKIMGLSKVGVSNFCFYRRQSSRFCLNTLRAGARVTQFATELFGTRHG